MHYNAKGIAYISCEWIFTFIELLAVTLRLYSRTFLTRSVGSDDFFILIGYMLDVVATAPDLKAFLNGWSQHESGLSRGEYSLGKKWEHISYMEVYMVFFFIRASVMLFVLRLLPLYKRWQRRVVYSIFLVNFLVTVYACITFGVSCVPFKANWDIVPNSKCFSKELLAISNQINAALSCVCDLATALIPQVLLWNVRMKIKTKRQLKVLFGLGLVTAALSVGRAATMTNKTLNDDTTWNMIPSYYFTMFESKLGLIISCGPALRQFWAYRSRVGTSLPTKRRQYPNEDFEKMRYRINLRDILWYREPPIVGNRVFDAAKIFQGKSPPPDASSSDPESSSRVTNSILDVWIKRMKKRFGTGCENEAARHPSSQTSNFTCSEVYEMREPRGVSKQDDVSSKKSYHSRIRGLFSHKSESSTGSSTQAPFLLSNSGTATNTTITTQNGLGFAVDDGLADELSRPKMKPHMDRK